MIPTSREESSATRSRGSGGGPSPPRPGGQDRGLVNRPYLTASYKNPHRVSIWEGGNLLHLEAPKFKSKVEYEEGPTRGRIEDYSFKSRQRCMRKIAMIDQREAGLPVFLTLTYPGEYSKEWQRWKRDIDAFHKALVRKWGDVWGPWKLEFQKRGAPHFHYLLWEGPKIKATQAYSKQLGRVLIYADPCDEQNQAVFNWISETWYRIVGSGDQKHLAAGTRIEPIHSWQGVTHYTSKYLAKTGEREFAPSGYAGRFWGIIRAAKWKVNKFEKDIKPDLFFRMRRVLRGLQVKAARRVANQYKERGQPPPAWTRKQGQRGRTEQGMHWFLDSVTGMKLLAWAASK